MFVAGIARLPDMLSKSEIPLNPATSTFVTVIFAFCAEADMLDSRTESSFGSQL